MFEHFRSTGSDPKDALDKALFSQMQTLAQRKKDAIKVNALNVFLKNSIVRSKPFIE
jgi:hypothetical protein